MPTLRRLFTLLALTVLLPILPATAEDHNFTMTVSVPFRFVLGEQKFPAGQYEVIGQMPNLLHLRDAKGRVLLSAITHNVEGQDPGISKLTFQHHGKKYVLSQVWLQGSHTGREIERVLSPSALAEPSHAIPMWILEMSEDRRIRSFQ